MYTSSLNKRSLERQYAMCLAGQIFDPADAQAVQLRLENLKSDHFFGEDFEEMMVAKALPPLREIAIRELIILTSHEIKTSDEMHS